MRCDVSSVWIASLLAICGVFSVSHCLAEKPIVQDSASEWQKGRRLTSTRRESYHLSAGTSVDITANSVATVQPKVKLLTNIDGLGPSAFGLQLSSGRIDIAINPKQRPASAVFVYGPRRTTVLARGGRVSVVAGPSGLAVGVYDGRDAASVGVNSTWRHISAGSSFAVSSAAPQGLESKLPAAPSHVVVNCPALAVDGSASTSRATWDPVLGAKRYIVDLINLESKTRKTLETSEPSLALRGLEPGRQELRVSAVDATGLSGAASEPASVNVVGLVLPPGAFVADGKVFLESRQQLTLTHVDGLEATYDGAQVYFKAANRVGLRGTRATTLHLRQPGAAERVSLELLPRDLHARVEILPALARWPRDKVVVRIQLPGGLSSASLIQVTPRLTVNNRTLDIGWARTEHSLETVISAPPSYPGPWVVRVEVVDQHGITLGRNFLEIASTAGLDDEDLPREVHRAPLPVRAAR